MDQAQTCVERLPLPALADQVRTVWVQRTGPRPYLQRNLPTGGMELHCPIDAVPRLVGPLTGASVQVLPAHTTMVGLRFCRSEFFARPLPVAVIAMLLDELTVGPLPGRRELNFPDPQLDDWAAAYHGGNLARLTAAKHTYDPDRLLHFPQAI